MTRRVPVEPTLYDADGSAAPVLHGRRCASCGHAFFPPQGYGCEACGALPELLAPEEMPGAGTLVASVDVRSHPLAPFTVGIIALDAGPAIRAVIETQGATLTPGTRMRATLVATDGRDGSEVSELRFVAADS
ncbi:MAG: zinc ribbon domain-containing protein [Acidimicrobiia bacterium]|nr:zinc ribbon domain-containing protein [Acidimicrobiia bacterium]